MKNLKKLLLLLLPAGVIMTTSCEGPMGKQGADANQSCTECHNNSAGIEAKQAQWEESLHAKGENAAYANRTGCVQCHTSQGFLEYVAEGSTADISVPSDPMQINCYTCHKIHDTYTSDDFALTKPGAEKLEQKYAGNVITWDKGTSNQCVSCHQARDVSPLPVADGADYTIANTRIGSHHAPNANMILGKIPFELAGEAYPTGNAHSSAEGCIDCHMAQPYGYLAGGHNMGMSYDAHGTETLLTTGCLQCHSSETATTIAAKYNTLKTAINDKLTVLRTQLTAAGIYNPSTGLAKAGTFKANAALAYLTYNTVTEDKSNGIHNPGYTRTLLDNAIASMTALGYPAAK
ncbi:MAG TPA: hypothetical protein VHO46_12345 [Bacteroidales bacterium]|nr:hypothetical protein [Bacteroidales bacterium]